MPFARRRQSGVSEYWVIDPDVDVVRVFRSEGVRFGSVLALSRLFRE